jgi:GNAT superfamily N-acetyltransferase
MTHLCPPSFVIRPAIAQDKWRIQKLLGQFDREAPWHALRGNRQRSRRLRYLVLGFMAALGINLVFLLGLKFLLGILGVASCSFAISLLGLVFSQEWRKFWIIEQKGRIVACGKLCNYATYSMLYNVLVAPECRLRGIGSALVKHLMEPATRPMYLACFPNKVGFYTRLGFVQMRSSDLSPMLRHELGISAQPEIVPLVLR